MPRTIRRKARQVPWGYEVDPNDDQLIRPVPEMLELLKIAKKAWEDGTSTQTDIAAWLSRKSGRHITRVGLRVRLRITEGKLKHRQRSATMKEAASRVKISAD